MAFLILGDIGFGQLASPSGYEGKLTISYAEHQVIEGKPLLQYIGDGLGEITLSFLFHADFCEPQRAWDDLVDLATSHLAFPLTQGNGLFLGRFVIAEMERTTIHAGDDGMLYAFECKLKLREYVDQDQVGAKKKEKIARAPGWREHGMRQRLPVRRKELPRPLVEDLQAGYALGRSMPEVIRAATRKAL